MIAHKVTIVVATGTDGAIGRGGDMPFRIKSDLRRFKEITMGHPVVMGRRTFESLPGALPGRTNIVITSREDFAAPGTMRARDFEDAIRMAANAPGGDNIMIIGGARVYGDAIRKATNMELTEVDATYPDADTFFPKSNPHDWSLRELSPWHTDESSGLRYRYVSLTKNTGE
ncbi:MAG: dihydrofolate reductase [Muribaculaceae bacterium]|nr:dihydrofolate reductase [Muribaculaceae bacterium]